MKKNLLLFITLQIMLCRVLYAQTEVSTHQYQQMYVVDSSRSFTIHTINDQKNWRSSPHAFNLGFCSYPCWIKLIVNKSKNTAMVWQVKVDYPILDSLWFFEKSASGQWNEIRSGELVAEKPAITHDRSFTFDLLSPKAIDTVYLKVKTQGSMYIPIKVDISSEPTLFDQFIEKVYGGYFGALLIMIFFNLALFLVIKDGSFLSYVLFIFLQAGIHFFFTGHHILFLPHYLHPFFNYALLFFMLGCNIFAALFSISFLDIKKYDARFHKMMLGLVYGSVLFIPFLLIVDYRISALYISVLYLITPITLLVAGIVCWHKKQVYARYFIVSWIVFLVSVVLLSLRTLGLIAGNNHLEVMVQLGSILDVVLIGIALGERYNNFREEKNIALEKSLEYSLLLEQQSRLQNIILEQKIKERTLEVEASKYKIEEQNSKLLEYSETLEAEVSQRTSDLSALVEELQLHVSNFEHYSYIVSHNLRSPVARIKGLISIVEPEKLSEQNQIILGHLEKSAMSLDIVVCDLNAILDIKNGKGISLEKVAIVDLIKEFEIQNDQQMVATKAKITLSSPGLSVINTIRIYIKSIFYNLISNAIKYKHPERDPNIHISILKNKKALIIRFLDNGKGIEMEKYANQIFGLYQRLATEQEIDGRGLGLYMVKAQTEFLKGTITVSSKLGIGTAFEITLPLNGIDE